MSCVLLYYVSVPGQKNLCIFGMGARRRKASLHILLCYFHENVQFKIGAGLSQVFASVLVFVRAIPPSIVQQLGQLSMLEVYLLR